MEDIIRMSTHFISYPESIRSVKHVMGYKCFSIFLYKKTNVQANFSIQDFTLYGVLKNGQVKRRVQYIYNPNLRFSQRCFLQFQSARL